MISTTREKGFQAKQEGDTNESSSKLISNNNSSSSSSRQWSRFRNPRIVRVSQSFGGKDRHSKVCTVRGLRDRRIRLSVPTAIQLYDLQDRLGVSQPSKVIDWLIDVTKNDIDNLPPLQIPQGLFGHHQFHHHHHQQQQQTMLIPSNTTTTTTTTSSLSPFFDGVGGIKINSTNVDDDDDDDDHGTHQDQSKYWDLLEASSSLMKAKGKEVERDLEDNNNKNATPLLNPYSYCHWEPSNLSLSSQFGSGHEFVSQQQQSADQNSILYSNDFPSGSHHHHLFFCPPAAAAAAAAAATMPSLFPTYAPYASNEQEGSHDHHSSRQSINHFQLLSSSQHNNNLMPINSLATSSLLVKPFPLNVNLGHAESNPSDKGDT